MFKTIVVTARLKAGASPASVLAERCPRHTWTFNRWMLTANRMRAAEPTWPA